MAAKKAPARKKKRPEPSAEDRAQSERFKEFAREHGADDPDALDRAFDTLQPKPKS